jgi:hypothetical protein
VTAYWYVYQPTPPGASERRACEIRDRNVSESLLWDRWRAEHAPTATDLRAAVVAAQAEGNGAA